MSRMAIFFLTAFTLGLALLLAWLGLTTLRFNFLGWFLLVSGATYFVGVLIVYWARGIRFWRPRSKGKMLAEEQDDRSFWFIVIGMIGAFFLPPVECILFKTGLPRPFFMQIAGLLFIAFGSALFIWARRTLGNFYSGHISVVDGQPLVQNGPYRFIRHPSYAGYILIALGLGLGYSSLSGCAITLLVLLPSVIYRIRVEDHLLAKHYSAQFVDYARRTKRLIPKVW